MGIGGLRTHARRTGELLETCYNLVILVVLASFLVSRAKGKMLVCPKTHQRIHQWNTGRSVPKSNQRVEKLPDALS